MRVWLGAYYGRMILINYALLPYLGSCCFRFRFIITVWFIPVDLSILAWIIRVLSHRFYRQSGPACRVSVMYMYWQCGVNYQGLAHNVCSVKFTTVGPDFRTLRGPTDLSFGDVWKRVLRVLYSPYLKWIDPWVAEKSMMSAPAKSANCAQAGCK